MLMEEYLRLVETRTHDDPSVLHRVLNLLTPTSPSSKSQSYPTISTYSESSNAFTVGGKIPLESVDGIVEVLGAYPELVLALNDFLPAGIVIDLENGRFVVNRNNMMSEALDINSLERFDMNVMNHSNTIDTSTGAIPTMESAKAFLQFVRDRCVMARKPMIYRHFKDAVLRRRSDPNIPVEDVVMEVKKLLLPAYPDIIHQFNAFLLPHHRVPLQETSSSTVSSSAGDLGEAVEFKYEPTDSVKCENGHVVENDASPYMNNAANIHLPSMSDALPDSYDNKNALQSLVDAATLLYPH